MLKKLPLMGHHKNKMEEEERNRSEERVSDVRVHGCPRSTHIYGYTYVGACALPVRCIERPAVFMDAYSWKLTYSELML